MQLSINYRHPNASKNLQIEMVGALVVWGFKEHDNRRPKLEFQKVFFCVLLAG